MHGPELLAYSSETGRVWGEGSSGSDVGLRAVSWPLGIGWRQ